MDYTPRPHILKSIANQGMQWWKVIAELVDNSLDAGANRVSIEYPRGEMVVTDDGNGVKDIASTVTLGFHDRQDTTALGTYGIGLKDAWLFCGHRMTVNTVRKEKRTRVVADIDELVKNNWQGSEPAFEDCEGVPSGTEIHFSLKKGKNKPSIDVFNRLAWVFTPAIQNGKQILFRLKGKTRTPILACVVPQFIDSVSDSFDVEGMEVAINIGILPDGVRMPFGPFWVSYGHRNIASTSLGAGSYSTMRMGGSIQLGKGWTLSKNKDDFLGYKEELGEAIYQRIKRLLIKADQLSEDIASSEMKFEVSDLINKGLDAARKELRGKNKNPEVGAVTPTYSGARRRKAKKTSADAGSATGENSKQTGKFSLDWADMEDVHKVGYYDSPANRVILNINHAFVRFAKDQGNTIAVYSVAMAIMCHHMIEHKNGEKLLFEIADFGVTFGRLLNSTNQEPTDAKTAS